MLLTNSLWHRLRISVPQKQTKHPMHAGENKCICADIYIHMCVQHTIDTNTFKRKLLHE